MSTPTDDELRAEETEEVYDNEPGADDSFKIYLREIARYRILSAHEEKVLAYWTRATWWKYSRDARQVFIDHNLRLVVSVAKKYQHRTVSLADRASAGNEGLIHAVNGFDPTKGFRFSTYATWWIKQAISKSLGDARVIPIPAHIDGAERVIRRLRNTLQQDLQQEPTMHDIWLALQDFIRDKYIEREIIRFRKREKREPLDDELATFIPTDEQFQAFAKQRNLALTESQIEAVLNLPITVSLETRIDEEGNELGDFLQAPTHDAPLISRDEATTIIAPLIEPLPNGDIGTTKIPNGAMMEAILMLRTGAEDGTPRTLEEVGAEFGKTRERIRQIETEAHELIKGKGGKRIRAILGGVSI